MSGKKYLDRDGKEITYNEWVKLFEDLEYKRVGFFETLANGERVSVSTVWLGVTNNFNPMFETQVYGGRNSGMSRRYETELEALVGHNEIVDIVQDTLY